MASIEVYKVTCRRCDTDSRVPGWPAAAEVAHQHAEHGGSIQIRREWLRAIAPALAGASA